MNRTELTRRVADATGIDRGRCHQVISAFIDEILDEVIAARGKVTLNEFGKFEVVRRGPRMARNPRTGEPIPLPARLMLTFTPSSKLTCEMNR